MCDPYGVTFFILLSPIALEDTKFSPAVAILCGFSYLPVAPSAKVGRFLYILHAQWLRCIQREVTALLYTTWLMTFDPKRD